MTDTYKFNSAHVKDAEDLTNRLEDLVEICHSKQQSKLTAIREAVWRAWFIGFTNGNAAKET